MSEYQYYEFCSINSPMTSEARKEMASLSSRTRISTHGASYVYNYGDFRGDPEKLVLKYFDVFFYINNWGTVRLMFKYPIHELRIDELKKYCIQNMVSCKQHGQQILVDIDINNEEGGGWIEGEGILPTLLPLYDEIKSKNYQIFKLILAVNDEFSGETENTLNTMTTKTNLSSAQQAFLENIGIDYKVA